MTFNWVTGCVAPEGNMFIYNLFRSSDYLVCVACICALCLSPCTITSRSAFDGEFQFGGRSPQSGLTVSAGNPQFIFSTVHNQGDIQVTISNDGWFGTAELTGVLDPLTGEIIRGITFPRGSGIVWGTGLLVIGGINGRDTVVTNGEFLPDDPPDHLFRYESLDKSGLLYSPSAHSLLDILCQYNDSTVFNPSAPLKHRPLGVRIRQRSMAWSGDNLGKFILVNCEIININSRPIRECFIGVSAGGQVGFYADDRSIARPLIGSLLATPGVSTCHVPDSLLFAYWMDNDGDPTVEQWNQKSPLGAMGVCLLQHPGNNPIESFNWSVYSDLDKLWFTPYRRADELKFPRNSINFPITDRAVYFTLSNGYRVYDQSRMAIDYSPEGWVAPLNNADIAAGGASGTFTLSSGPFDLGPGQTAYFTYALVGGENVHVNPTDFANYWNPYNPQVYYEKLDFTDLATNARWAKWVYDNPGVDTDGDGYFGKFRVCDGDTQWYEGDGVPDFRADVPPPSPKLKIIPSIGKLTIRWNGYYSENTIDPFTRQKDFEGYRVYVGLDDRESSMSTMISWDYQDYNRWYLKKKPNNTFAWVTNDLPFTIDSLRTLYGQDFSPLLYTKDNPLHISDTLYSFTSVDYNLSTLMAPGVHKVYPEARYLGTDTTQWTEDDLTREHGEPLPKYYEYEYELDNLLPTIPQYVSVTAFDFGFAKGNIPAKESSKRQNMDIAYAQTSADSATEKNLNVYVYPNPYLYHVDYAAQGYENHDNQQIPSRSHRINFGNLPPKCRISIFTLDGDLVRSWEHDYLPSDPQAMHDAWDLITRNTMLAVSGLYYWVVEAPDRTQIGKLVIVE